MSIDYTARVRIKGAVEIEAEVTHAVNMTLVEKTGILKLLESCVAKYKELAPNADNK